MKPSDIEDLLWELSATEAGSATTHATDNAPADEMLIAYRAGRLTATAEAELERQLAKSAAARGRLLELAELTPESPSPAIRDAVLNVDGATRSSWQRGLWLAAAVITLLVAFQLVLPHEAPDLPADLQFDVRVEGLTQVRSGQLDVQLAEAYPQTRLRLMVEPRSLALAELDFGLYRQVDGQGFEYLEPGSRITLETHRGSAVFTAHASDLVGARPGTYPLLLVAARRGELPDPDALDSPSEVEALFHHPAYRAHRLELILLRPPDGGP